jgi:hypothetical protein
MPCALRYIQAITTTSINANTVPVLDPEMQPNRIHDFGHFHTILTLEPEMHSD